MDVFDREPHETRLSYPKRVSPRAWSFAAIIVGHNASRWCRIRRTRDRVLAAPERSQRARLPRRCVAETKTSFVFVYFYIFFPPYVSRETTSVSGDMYIILFIVRTFFLLPTCAHSSIGIRVYDIILYYYASVSHRSRTEVGLARDRHSSEPRNVVQMYNAWYRISPYNIRRNIVETIRVTTARPPKRVNQSYWLLSKSF